MATDELPFDLQLPLGSSQFGAVVVGAVVVTSISICAASKYKNIECAPVLVRLEMEPSIWTFFFVLFLFLGLVVPTQQITCKLDERCV